MVCFKIAESRYLFQVCAAHEVPVPVFMQPYGVVEPRIVGGQPAKRGQFPYQAGIVTASQAFCGGSLIGHKWVLTAGHCVHRAKSFTVTLGETDRKANEPGRVIATTTKAILHENFSGSTVTHDIAILQLPQDVQYSGESHRSSSTLSLQVLVDFVSMAMDLEAMTEIVPCIMRS